jgi:hypothetical protein
VIWSEEIFESGQYRLSQFSLYIILSLFVAELNYLVADMSSLSISYYQMAYIIDDITRESFASWITSLDNQPRGNIEEAQELVTSGRSTAARQTSW